MVAKLHKIMFIGIQKSENDLVDGGFVTGI